MCPIFVAWRGRSRGACLRAPAIPMKSTYSRTGTCGFRGNCGALEVENLVETDRTVVLAQHCPPGADSVPLAPGNAGQGFRFLLVPQGFDRVEAGRPLRRPHAEEDSHDRAEGEGEHHRPK